MGRHSPIDEPEDVGPAVQAVPTPDGPIVVPVEPAKSSRKSVLFQDKYLPHWGFGAITTLYVGFNLSVGIAAVPPTISLGWTTTLGLWFHYLIGQRKESK